MKKYLFLSALSVVAFCGCTKQDEKARQTVQAKPNTTAKSAVAAAQGGRYTDLPLDAVLVRVGTNAITRADFDKIVNLRAKIVKMTIPQVQQGNAVNVSAVRMPLLAQLRETYRMQTALLNWAEEKSIKPSKEDIEKFQQGFLRGCKHFGSDFSKFVKKNFTEEEAHTINERVHIEAICDKAKRYYIENNADKIDKVDVDAFVKRVEKYNQMAAATNALVWAHATNLWLQVKGGADFGDLSDQYSEDEGHTTGGSWGVFRYEDLANDGNLAKTVAALEVGAVSQPIEADNGLNIIKLVDIVNANGEPVDGPRTGNIRFELARIFLRLPEIYEIPPRDEAEKQMKDAAQNRAVRLFIEKLTEGDGAEYPSGTVIFDVAKQALNMPRMLMQQGVTQEKLDKLSDKKGTTK